MTTQPALPTLPPSYPLRPGMTLVAPGGTEYMVRKVQGERVTIGKKGCKRHCIHTWAREDVWKGLRVKEEGSNEP